MILDHTPVAVPVTEHPFYRTRHELLSVPLTSPRLAEACEGRTFVVRDSTGEPDQVTLRAGAYVWCPSEQVATRIRARIEARRIIRDGYAPILAWLGEVP